MYTSPLINGAPEAIITLKNGWSIHAVAENLAYVYRELGATACFIKVNALLIDPVEVDMIYFNGIQARLQIDPTSPGGMKWI